MPNKFGSVEEIIKVSDNDGFKFIPIKQSHILKYQELEILESHKDPFDRLLISTAISENLTLISADEKFKLYTSEIKLIEA